MEKLSEQLKGWRQELANLHKEADQLNRRIVLMRKKVNFYESFETSVRMAGGNPDGYSNIPYDFFDSLAQNGISLKYEK
jgi:hypothetical protein